MSNDRDSFKDKFAFKVEGLESLVDDVKQLLNLDQLIDLAQKLEEKQQSGEIRTEVNITSRPLSSIPRRGNIPRSRVTTVSGSDREVASPDIVKPEKDHPTNEKPQAIAELVGGLGDILAQLRDLVEIPLKRPDILAQLGLEAPKGVLLVGSSGTGKTLTARSLAHTLGVNYMAIVAPEILSKYYGEAETRLRQIFEKAVKSSPCLIFIDEIDALVPNRANVEGEVEKRLVAQLLGLMDGFAETKGVIVLAATNRPDAIDPALRRSGRFDREIVFPVPDRSARREILSIHTRSMPLTEDVDLDDIADRAHGYVGADIKGLCQAAATNALRRQVASLAEIPDRLDVDREDFEVALKQIKPAVLRSLQIQVPKVQWSEIGGLAKVKQTLQEAVAGALVDPALYAHTLAKATRGVLLYGPPGTGKTLLAKAIATQAQANFIAVAGSELLTKWVGASEQAIRQLFAQARQASPCVIFIDEIDTLAPARGSYQGDSGVSDRVIGQLLTELDGLQSTEGLLVIAATNRRDFIDPALLRSGRIELHLLVDLPDPDSRSSILAVHNRDRPLAASLDLQLWAKKTENWNGADLAFLSNRAAIFAIRRYQRSDVSLLADLQITHEDFEQAFAELISQRN
ncbi:MULTISPECIES: AAA family ATPase [Pseudanabaena]|uniref:Adenosinetriphosphatase n=2 Tax=Pseudanabaena TaxID=1152 RepID=L8MW35_9CYAN|nr:MULTISPECIES: AAA family ATPase [Pseudanabaena]ELS31019.1 Adenosinetriphosphatase [Pseudanabaena biceps PCC 7429]MDG3496716.1 AAA family ATPase [Pseudanabaena catenata USMAC16]